VHTTWRSMIVIRVLAILIQYTNIRDRLCGPVDRAPGYRPTGPASIPGATRFSEE
jgi:hypothetical protein